MHFKTRHDGTLELSGSPRDLDDFADMVRDAAHRGEAQFGTLMNAHGVTPIVVVAHEEYEIA